MEEKQKGNPGRKKTRKFPKTQSRPKKRNEEVRHNRPNPDEAIRLNRFIAQAGICSRREADELIAKGLIKVNGKVIIELGTKIIPRKDSVEYRGKTLKPQNFVYILFNKPKNMITTTSDPQGRKTVIDAVAKATNERVFPVGRLDRNTTGLLLITNDGEITKKLTHPSHKIAKIYHVKLDKPVSEEDMERLLNGISLEDGPASVDKIDYVIGSEANEVGVEIHIGRNRIVRRMFEALGYKVIGLDRTTIGYLTKKRLPRGKWRLLTEREIGYLKMI